ncbi:hypothetical protein [Actinosynnema sp. NPDC023587]|uniref:hypothetical protein n=1 Tax=Actinosynnema sp. NPDC023587 TaxID=3154695 RepID=UPI0033C6079C
MPRIGTAPGSASGFAGGVAATVVSSHWPLVALALLTLVVLVVSLMTTPLGAALTVVQCWGLYASFVVSSAGYLVLDWPALAVLAAAGTASLGGLARGRAPAPSPARS